MSQVKSYIVYILTDKRHTVPYTGVTSDMSGRAQQHKQKQVEGVATRLANDYSRRVRL